MERTFSKNSYDRVKVSILMILIIGLGFFLRFHNLGIQSFHYDEAFHVFAAKSIIETGENNLPGGKPYLRSPLVTSSGVFLFKHFGISEIVARVPSVVLGTVTIFLIFYFVRRHLGTTTAIISSLLYATSPFAISLSRFFRYYSELQVFYITLFFLLLTLVITPYSVKSFKTFIQDIKSNKIKIMLTSIAIIILTFLLYKDNKITMLIYVSMAFIIILRSVSESIRSNSYEALKKIDLILLASSFVIVFLVFILSPITIKKLYWQTQSFNISSTANSLDVFYYAKILFNDYPFSLILLPLGSIFLCKHHSWKGAFIVSGFFIPLVIMSTIFQFRIDRFMGFLMPLFFIIIGGAIVFLSNYLKDKIFIHRLHMHVVMVLLIICVFSYHSIGAITNIHNNPKGHYTELQSMDMKYAKQLFAKKMTHGDVIIATPTLVISHYLDRNVDYILDENKGESPSNLRTSLHYSGATIIFNKKVLSRIINTTERGWIIFEKKYWDGGYTFSTELRNFIKKKTTNEKKFNQAGMKVFTWGITNM